MDPNERLAAWEQSMVDMLRAAHQVRAALRRARGHLGRPQARDYFEPWVRRMLADDLRGVEWSINRFVNGFEMELPVRLLDLAEHDPEGLPAS